MVSQLCIPTQERGNDRTFDVIRHSARSEKTLRHSARSEAQLQNLMSKQKN